MISCFVSIKIIQLNTRFFYKEKFYKKIEKKETAAPFDVSSKANAYLIF